MRTAIRTRSASAARSPTWFSVLERTKKFCSAAWVARNPRIRKLNEISGNNTLARKKIPRASEVKALNRWSRSRIGGRNFKQAVLDQSVQQIRQIRAQQFRFHVILVQKLLIRHFNLRRGGHQLPHTRAGPVQAKIALRLNIQEHGLFI